jgi:glutamate synthase (NADPH) large chain
MQAFGYTVETLQFMLLPLVQQARDPVGSMGNDSALACLSDKPRMLYDYFKQLFAQVTNPAIDSIREEIIMSLECYIGPEQNLLEADGEALPAAVDPASDPDQSGAGGAIKQMDHRGWRPRRSTSASTGARGRRVCSARAGRGSAPRRKRRSTRATAW